MRRFFRRTVKSTGLFLGYLFVLWIVVLVAVLVWTEWQAALIIVVLLSVPIVLYAASLAVGRMRRSSLGQNLERFLGRQVTIRFCVRDALHVGFYVALLAAIVVGLATQ